MKYIIGTISGLRKPADKSAFGQKPGSGLSLILTFAEPGSCPARPASCADCRHHLAHAAMPTLRPVRHPPRRRRSAPRSRPPKSWAYRLGATRFRSVPPPRGRPLSRVDWTTDSRRCLIILSMIAMTSAASSMRSSTSRCFIAASSMRIVDRRVRFPRAHGVLHVLGDACFERHRRSWKPGTDHFSEDETWSVPKSKKGRIASPRHILTRSGAALVELGLQLLAAQALVGAAAAAACACVRRSAFIDSRARSSVSNPVFSWCA